MVTFSSSMPTFPSWSRSITSSNSFRRSFIQIVSDSSPRIMSSTSPRGKATNSSFVMIPSSSWSIKQHTDIVKIGNVHRVAKSNWIMCHWPVFTVSLYWLSLPSPLLSQRRRYCDPRRHAMCVSATLVSAAKVMRHIGCSVVVTMITAQSPFSRITWVSRLPPHFHPTSQPATHWPSHPISSIWQHRASAAIRNVGIHLLFKGNKNLVNLYTHQWHIGQLSDYWLLLQHRNKWTEYVHNLQKWHAESVKVVCRIS